MQEQLPREPAGRRIGARFLWFVSLPRSKETNTAAGPRPRIKITRDSGNKTLQCDQSHHNVKIISPGQADTDTYPPARV